MSEIQFNFLNHILLLLLFSGLQIRVHIEKTFFSSKTYVVGTQKNRLNETVLLSTPKCMFKNNHNFTLIKFLYLDLIIIIIIIIIIILKIANKQFKDLK